MLSDETLLIKSAQKGIAAALEALLFAYEKKVYNVAYRYMGNEADACERAQEALLKIYKSMQTFRIGSSFQCWVYRLTVNTCLDSLRNRKKENTFEDHQGSASPGASPEAHCLQIENGDHIQKAINTLCDDHRITVILRDIQGLSYDEIAKTLSVSIGTVKSRLRRGRQRLKEILLANQSIHQQ